MSDNFSQLAIDGLLSDITSRINAMRRSLEMLANPDGSYANHFKRTIAAFERAVEALTAAPAPAGAPDPDVEAAKIELEAFERQHITTGGSTVDANAVADMLLAVHGFLSRRTAQPAPDVTDEDVQRAAQLAYAGIYTNSEVARVRTALTDFVQRRSAPATREAPK